MENEKKKKVGKYMKYLVLHIPHYIYVCLLYIYIYVSQPNIVDLYCIVERRLRSYLS